MADPSRRLPSSPVGFLATLATCLGIQGGCARHVADTPAPFAPALVTTERGPKGGRLVAVNERGTRVADITRMGVAKVIDSHPNFSPGGDFLVFASSRGRQFPATSLWVVPAKSAQAGRRITRGTWVDRDPVWGAGSLYYSSNKRGTFDLFRVPVDPGGQPLGPSVRLTSSPTDELSPALSPDGAWLLYMALDRKSGTSRILRVPVAGGVPVAVTEGPADLTPTWAGRPDEVILAAPVKGRGDIDLFVLNTKTGARAPLADEPYADQTGPVATSDGRFVFATSLYRSRADGAPVLASLVVLDRDETPPKWRALHDPAYVESRIGVAVAKGALRQSDLRQNAVYLDALRLAVKKGLMREEARPH